MASLTQQVKTNLIHYNLWKSVSVHNNKFCCGIPPSKLNIDDRDDLTEWVIPKLMSEKEVASGEIESWFTEISTIAPERPARVTVALINDDGTIVYYFIHDGIVKPRQN